MSALRTFVVFQCALFFLGHTIRFLCPIGHIIGIFYWRSELSYKKIAIVRGRGTGISGLYRERESAVSNIKMLRRRGFSNLKILSVLKVLH